VCSQALGGHQRLHRPIKGKLARKRKYTEDDNTLFDSSETKKILSKPSNFEVSQELKKILDCVESKQDMGELLSLNSKSQKTPECSCSYECKICGKSFESFQALGGHTTLHRSIKGQLVRTKDNNSQSHSLEAKKIVSQPSSFEVSQEKILHCVESKQDFSELLFHLGFDKSSNCSKTRFIPLPSSLQSKSHSSISIKEQLARTNEKTEDGLFTVWHY